jgi:hypothetical protein
MAKCDLCGSSEGVLTEHYENHLRRRINICRRCHSGLHIAIHFHAYDILWNMGFGDPVKRDFYRELHEILVKNRLINCDKCRIV